METIKAISKRVSVREYTTETISKNTLEALVDAGRRAPTARRMEPWEFVIVTERKVLKQLGEIATSGSFVKDAAACIIIYCRETKYYLEDGCAATENILLAAADMGLGACWIAGDKKPYAKELAKLFGVPDGLKLISLISLGWPKKDADQKRSRSLGEIIHWEKF